MSRHLAVSGDRPATELIISAADSGRESVRPTRWISLWHPPMHLGKPPSENRCARPCPALRLVRCVRHGLVRQRRSTAGRVSYPGILAVLPISSDCTPAGSAVSPALVPAHPVRAALAALPAILHHGHLQPSLDPPHPSTHPSLTRRATDRSSSVCGISPK